MPFQIFDRLYGNLELSDEELRLFQTKEMTRLRHISLSAVPPCALANCVCASKFEHSVGTGFLAKLVSNTCSFQEYAKEVELQGVQIHELIELIEGETLPSMT